MRKYRVGGSREARKCMSTDCILVGIVIKNYNNINNIISVLVKQNMLIEWY